MGFALWIEGDTAWCAGAHEYRPMGVAVIASTQLFSTRDFDPLRPPMAREGTHFHGLFASLVDVNHYLGNSRSQRTKKKLQHATKRQLSIT
jgi:hypothetical protein